MIFFHAFEERQQTRDGPFFRTEQDLKHFTFGKASLDSVVSVCSSTTQSSSPPFQHFSPVQASKAGTGQYCAFN